MQRLMDRLVDLPLMLLDARGDVLAWNTRWRQRCSSDWSSVPVRERNVNPDPFPRHDALRPADARRDVAR